MNRDCLKEIKALGRPFQIGSLYNYNEDTIIKETCLWDPEDVRIKLVQSKDHKSKIKIYNTVSYGERMLQLGLDDHTLISLLSSLIHDKLGASKYIDDQLEPNEASACLHCRIKTHRDYIDPKSMSNFEFVCHNKVLREATHVIVGIDYGLQCFCIARQPFVNDEDRMDVVENLQQRFEHWRQCLLDEKVALESHLEGIQYSLYTDLQPTQAPTTEEDFYRNCLKVMTSDLRNAVPLTVWLCPLKDVAPKVPRRDICRDLSKRLVETIQQLWSQLNDVQQLTKHVLHKVKRLPPSPALWDGIDFFRRCVEQHRLLVLDRLKELICKVRRGAEDESVLEAMATMITQSPFNPERLIKWITAKQNEITALELVASLRNIRLVFDPPVLKQDHRHRTLVLSLPNFGPGNSLQLEQMRLYVERNSQLVPWNEPLTDMNLPAENEWQELRSSVIRFLAFASRNAQEVDVDYMVSYGQVVADRSVKLQFYEEGSLVRDQVKFPPKPNNLRITGNQRGVITLQWDCETSPWVNQYVIEYRETETIDWNQIHVHSRKFDFGSLHYKQAYHFRVASVSAFGLSEFSAEVGPEAVRAVCDAPSIQLRYATNESLSIQWTDPPLDGRISITGYVVSYWPLGEESSVIRVSTTVRVYSIEKLQADTVYAIQVAAECGSFGTGSAGQPVTFRTSERADRVACVVREVSTPSPEESVNGLDVFHVPIRQELLQKEIRIRRCQLGSGVNKFRRKTILVVGPTGSGKSTFINGMLNYILGVRWEDDFRFKLIREQGKSQAHSQTQEVVAYDIFHMKGSNIDYSLTIVDTPGFGDTQGLERDKAIMEQLRQYFQCPHGIQELEAVCFLLQASLPRLTVTQRYIYDSILSIFGKDIKDNIRLMITFADNQEPPVLSSIKESDIPYPADAKGNPLHHKFNNCSLFSAKSADPCDDVFTKMFYEMGTRSFCQFFDDLRRMKTTSLSLTKEVLLERKRLEVVVEGLQQRIQHGLNQVEEFNQIKKALADNDQQMNANQNFNFQVEFQVQETVDISRSGHYVTNCQNCKWTCHYPCKYANDAERKSCLAMDPDGKCRVCPANCSWSAHFNQKFKYEWVTRKVDRSSDDIRRQYEQAHAKKLTNQELKDQLAKELETLEKGIVNLVTLTYPSIQRLNEIALKPHPFTAPEYIDLIIKAEKQDNRQPESLNSRIKTLEKLKQIAEIQDKINNNKPLFNVSSALTS